MCLLQCTFKFSFLFVVFETGLCQNAGKSVTVLGQGVSHLTGLTRDPTRNVVVEVPTSDRSYHVGFLEDGAHHDSAEPDGRDAASEEAVAGIMRIGKDVADSDDTRGCVQREGNRQDPGREPELEGPS